MEVVMMFVAIGFMTIGLISIFSDAKQYLHTIYHSAMVEFVFFMTLLYVAVVTFLIYHSLFQ